MNQYQEQVEKLRTEFIELAKNNYNPKEKDVILNALDFSIKKHENQFRKSGEPYIIHPILTAMKLIDWKMDYCSVSAGLLHDVIEDTDATYQDLLVNFGFQIADLVQTVSKVTQYSKKQRSDNHKVEADNMYIIQVFLSLSKDLRAIVVKLADRMHNLETIHHLDITKQQLIARETLDIYCTIAGRMGMYTIKTKLQDMCFKIIDPHTYSNIYKKIQKLEQNGANSWERIRNLMMKMLESEQINYRMEFRVKGIYSIYKKMEKGYLPENIHDIFAMRIIVQNELQCYKVLGLIHLNFIYIKNAFKDFISSPKWNLYRSIHTTVINNNSLIEFQIRTEEMHRVSQMGLAAHWKYKESSNNSEYLKISKRLIQEFLQGREVSIDSIKEISKTDVFDVFVSNDNDFYVCTSKSTLLDLAYRYDAEKFEYLSSVFKNGESLTYDTRVNKGDVVQFAYSEQSQIEKNWLQATENLTVINHINSIFQQKEKFIQHNNESFLEGAKEFLKVNDILPKLYKKRLSYLGYKELSDFLADVNRSEINQTNLYYLFSEKEELWKNAFKNIKKNLAYKIFFDTYFLPPPGIVPDKIIIPECCSKFPNIALIGLLKNNILKVHRYDCSKANVNQGKRIVMEWDKKALEAVPRMFKVKLKIFGKLTDSVANQIIKIIMQNNILILKVEINKNINDTDFQGDVVLRIGNDEQLTRLIAQLKLQGFVKNVEII